MPIGALGFIWLVIKRLIEAKAQSVLDVGCATGRFGMIARDYMECIVNKTHPCKRSEWKTRIEGVEVFEPYLSLVSHYVYDKIYVADAREFFKDPANEDKKWDVIVMLDVIEHLPEADARALLERMVKHASKYVVIGGPYGRHPQDACWGNEHDAHEFDLTEDMFKGFDLEQLWHVDRSIVAVIKCHDGPYDKPMPETFRVVDMLGDMTKVSHLQTDVGHVQVRH